MSKMSPSEHAALWAQKFGASSDRYKAGVQRVQGSPMAKAVQAQDRMLSAYTEAVTSGRWAARTGAVSEAQWKQACVDKGASALAASARVAQEKVMRAEAQLGPIRDSIVSSLPARGTIEENLERARQMALKMHEARKRA